MKPLPAQLPVTGKAAEATMPSIPTTRTTAISGFSSGNRRASPCTVQRVYPWLLFASTACAAVFCLLYITKPVVYSTTGNFPVLAGPANAVATNTATRPAADSLLPDQHRLPGEKSNAIPAAGNGATPTRSSANAALAPGNGDFEQTNLRIQHILSAETPAGPVAKIDIDVPVLYHSRTLRWTQAEAAEARELLEGLAIYQEKSRELRSEGANLLAAWNHLVEKSIPAGQLRADSPSLPVNQRDAQDIPRPATLDTTQSIRIGPAGK